MTNNTWLSGTLKFRNGEPIYDGDSVAPCLVFCVVFYGLLLVFPSVFRLAIVLSVLSIASLVSSNCSCWSKIHAIENRRCHQ